MGYETMKEALSVKNFGPIKNIVIEDIKPFTVLIGESGSGKSTLMKVLALFRWIYKMQNIRSYLKHSNIEKSTFTYNMNTYIKNCGFEQFINKDTEIIYTSYDEAAKHRHQIGYQNKRLSVSGIVGTDSLEFIKIGFISETRNIIPQWLDKSQDANLGFYFGELASDFKLAGDEIDELPINFLNLKFKITKTSTGKKYVLESTDEDKYEVLYENSSSGIQNVIPLLIITEYYTKYFSFKQAFDRSVLKYLLEGDRLTEFKAVKNVSELPKKIYLHIEEPELSLYPRTQCLLIDNLVEKCFCGIENNLNLMISTHSPYIINHLNLLIKRFDKQSKAAKYNYDNLAVYQVEDGEINDLKVLNKRLIDTNALSDPINEIYNEYEGL
jgi:predicted ATPase